MSETIAKKDYKALLKGLCVVEISGESCANCLTLMPILQELVENRDDVTLVHVEADFTRSLLGVSTPFKGYSNPKFSYFTTPMVW